MNSPVIKVEHLSKRYKIGASIYGRGARTFRDMFAHKVAGFLRSSKKEIRTNNTIWALKDVSFEVERGEVVGIIGRNGAGKSTLLKLISRITSPTDGRITLHGRVASLLEVGTGFSMELTGRENIYLNGAILGMTNREIRKKFDEIVEFAEIEDFLDTPVKRYSSGMYLRLAFAVGAHLNPEILLVDEVLAVGDIEFQKKCLGKMKDFSERGRTVLFVSHNLSAIKQLCTRGVLLHNGRIRKSGDVDLVVREYLDHSLSVEGRVSLFEHVNRREFKYRLFEWIELRDSSGAVTNDFAIGDDITIAFKVNLAGTGKKVKFAVEMRSSDGLDLCNMVDDDSRFVFKHSAGSHVITLRMPDIRLYPGTYLIGVWAGATASRDTYDYIQDCISFRIIGGGDLTSRHLPRSAGIFFFTPIWREEREGS